MCIFYFWVYLCFMKHTIRQIDFSWASRILSQGSLLETPDLFFIRNSSEFVRVFPFDVPFFSFSSCCLQIIEGYAVYQINTHRYEVHPGEILLVPKDSVINILHFSNDLSMIICSLGERYLSSLVGHFQLRDETWEKICYLSRVFELCLRDRDYESTIGIQQIIVNTVSKAAGSDFLDIDTRQEPYLNRFVAMIHEYGSQKRPVTFYADKLSVTPNWLSTVVKSESGRTILDWIKSSVIGHSKVLLAHTDLPIYEIASNQGFSSDTEFCREFKRSAGMTPLQFRRMAIEAMAPYRE